MRIPTDFGVPESAGMFFKQRLGFMGVSPAAARPAVHYRQLWSGICGLVSC